MPMNTHACLSVCVVIIRTQALLPACIIAVTRARPGAHQQNARHGACVAVDDVGDCIAERQVHKVLYSILGA